MPNNKIFFYALIIFCINITNAQDLDPRAYGKVPKNANIVITGLAFSSGEVVTEPSMQIDNIKANVQTTSVGFAHSFGLFGMTSQILVAVPYTWAQVSGDVQDISEKITRAGFSDMRLRFSVLFLGAPARTAAELAKSKRQTILGASLNMIIPTGQFNSDKLINLGTNRWSFRPEIAISQPIGKRWLVDVYTGIWVFTDNNQFYPGNSKRTQNPVGTLQAHVSYNFNPLFWLAINSTYYTGGSSYVNGQPNKNRQSNTRLGITAVFPTGKFSSLKVAASTGAVVRIGQDFDTFSIGWQKVWLQKNKK